MRTASLDSHSLVGGAVWARWKRMLLSVALGLGAGGFLRSAEPGPVGDPAPAREGNRILPLSNGLSFELSLPALITRYGPPVSDERPSALPIRQLTFRDFAVTLDRDSGRMTAIRLINGVALACGLKVGSPWGDVVAEFGREVETEDAVQLEVSGVLVSLERDGSVVSSIRVRRSTRTKTGADTAKLRAPLAVGASPSRLEPFSNGVLISDPLEVVLAKLGPPERDDRSHPAVRAMVYKDAVFLFDALDRGFHRAILLGEAVKLACGVAVGSTESEVRRLLPQAREPIEGAALQYSEAGCLVRIVIKDGRVEQIELRRMNGPSSPNRLPR